MDLHTFCRTLATVTTYPPPFARCHPAQKSQPHYIAFKQLYSREIAHLFRTVFWVLFLITLYRWKSIHEPLRVVRESIDSERETTKESKSIIESMMSRVYVIKEKEKFSPSSSAFSCLGPFDAESVFYKKKIPKFYVFQWWAKKAFN